MSANEKQTISVKQKRIQEREAAAKRQKAFKIKMIVCIVIFAILATAIVVLNSDWFYRTCTAVEINGMKWSIADYNFHFNNQYTIIRNELAGMLGEEAADKIPERGSSLKKMVFSEKTGETWYEYITGLTMDTLTEVTILYQDAVADGHKINEREEMSMFNEINTLAMYANYNGVDSSTYTEVMYGKGVNIEVYERNLNILYVADSYAKIREADFDYTDAELDAFYNEGADEFDHYTYRIFYIRAEGDEPTEGDMAAAKAKADAFAAKVTDEASFAAACREFCTEAEKARYEDDNSSLSTTAGDMLATTYKAWLQDGARKEGDVTVVASSLGYYVVYFVDRSSNDYNSADVQFMLMLPEMPAREDYDTDEAYEAEVAKRTEDAENNTQAIYDEWVAGGDFSDLKAKYGGYLYESGDTTAVSKAYFEKAVTDWLFAEERQAGDIEKIITVDGAYYVVKYVGANEPYNRVYARQTMSGNDFNEWLDVEKENATISASIFRNLSK